MISQVLEISTLAMALRVTRLLRGPMVAISLPVNSVQTRQNIRAAAYQMIPKLSGKLMETLKKLTIPSCP